MFARNSSTRALFAGAALLCALMLAQQAEGAGLFACLKDQVLNTISNRMIANSELVEQYKAAVETAAARFEESKATGSVAGMDDKEQENHFLKLVAEEVNKLSESIKDGKVKPTASPNVIDDNIRNCFKHDKDDDDDESFNTDIWYRWDPKTMSELDEEDNDKLFSELTQLEEDMGFALDETTKATLKGRTKSVLTDILNNEARQIAMSVLTAYLSGGVGSMGGILAPFLGTLKVKMVEFLINAIIDVVAAVMGRKIEITPAAEVLASQQLVPAAA